MAEDYGTHCRGYGEKEIAARVCTIKGQEEMEWRRRRAAHLRHEIGVK